MMYEYTILTLAEDATRNEQRINNLARQGYRLVFMLQETDEYYPKVIMERRVIGMTREPETQVETPLPSTTAREDSDSIPF